MKVEAAGWDKLGLCDATEEAKDDLLKMYQDIYNITLNTDNIGEYNPGLYYIAKLCLNSLWGKFAQRELYRETQTTFTEKDFKKIVFDDLNDVIGVVLHNTDTRTVTYSKINGLQPSTASINVAIAAFTTSYARLRLYKVLDLLGPDVGYYDTDSIIYRHTGRVPLITGPLLGDLTDELSHGDYIVEFVSTGPKSYAYRTLHGKVCVKVKGFTLNFENAQRINFDTLRDLALRTISSVETSTMQFIIDDNHTIRTDPSSTKKLSFTFDKREILWPSSECFDSITTRPWRFLCVSPEDAIALKELWK